MERLISSSKSSSAESPSSYIRDLFFFGCSTAFPLSAFSSASTESFVLFSFWSTSSLSSPILSPCGNKIPVEYLLIGDADINSCSASGIGNSDPCQANSAFILSTYSFLAEMSSDLISFPVIKDSPSFQ